MSKRSTSAQPRVLRAMHCGEIVARAAEELATGLAQMLGGPVACHSDPATAPRELRVQFGHGRHTHAEGKMQLRGDAFAVTRAGANDEAVVLRGGSARALLHGASDLLERLGARFAVGAPPSFERIDAGRLGAIKPYVVEPAFRRRALVSDIMTWNYNFADRFALHLSHDREFIPWMARRGMNAFSYIRHQHDTRYRIDELAAAQVGHGIEPEYGGHVLQILLPRDEFARHPEYFPADGRGARIERGNLCVSNPDAMRIVAEGAVACVAEHPENRLLHIWGADVWEGAWCRCGACAGLSPQLQYMRVVNEIAGALARRCAAPPPVAYLAYHDTIDPDPALRPRENVHFEWAPRERCYRHAIDDAQCEVNPRYLESLRRYLELFDGRGHVFEYYADAILFGGIAVATPAVIMRDLRAYRRLGVDSVACLTFGAYSVLACPVNLEAFVRASRAPEESADAAREYAAEGRHRECAAAMREGYKAIERASELVLDYADVMRPQGAVARAARKRIELTEAARDVGQAIEAVERAAEAAQARLARAEAELWKYSREALNGIAAYFGAMEGHGSERARRGAEAIGKIADAVSHVRAIDAELKGTWGAYDLEWIREIWLDALRRALDGQAPAGEAR